MKFRIIIGDKGEDIRLIGLYQARMLILTIFNVS
jgi:GTPase Era involved in 16S rRNA processing